MWTNRWTDRHQQAIVTLCNFANVPKNQQLFPVPFRGQISVSVEGHRNIGLVYGKVVPVLQNHHSNKAYGRAQILLHAFLILSEDGAEYSHTLRADVK